MLIVTCCIALCSFALMVHAQMVINTWPFTAANQAAWDVLVADSQLPQFQTPSYQALEAAVAGCSTCETIQCDGTVGFGGSPDERGETTLDAMVIDAVRMDVGAVASLRRVKNAVGVARAVLFHTTHTILAGDQATEFAAEMGFPVESLSTNKSQSIWKQWKQGACQPNYRINVSPDPKTSCGPYKPTELIATERRRPRLHASPSATASHDTISMVTLDQAGRISAATSTNGAAHKVPGRVGDGPIPGAGAFAEQGVGGCGGTGDGDLHLRFSPCYQAVENLRQGMSPTAAAEDAMRRIMKYYPVFQGALFVVDMHGNHGAAGVGWTFTYTVQNSSTAGPLVISVPPLSP